VLGIRAAATATPEARMCGNLVVIDVENIQLESLDVLAQDRFCVLEL
jgi:hypothetical protein